MLLNISQKLPDPLPGSLSFQVFIIAGDLKTCTIKIILRLLTDLQYEAFTAITLKLAKVCLTLLKDSKIF